MRCFSLTKTNEAGLSAIGIPAQGEEGTLQKTFHTATGVRWQLPHSMTGAPGLPGWQGEGSFSMSRAGALAFKAMADLVKSVEVVVSTGFGELFSLPPALSTCTSWRAGIRGRPSQQTSPRAGMAHLPAKAPDTIDCKSQFSPF